MKARTIPWLLFLLSLAASAVPGMAYSVDHPHDHRGHPAGETNPAQALPHDPASDLDRLAARPVPAAARCPVCGMYPARYPRWAAQLIFNDGETLFFDSPVELFRFLLDMGRYHDAHGPDDVARAYVSDAGDGQWVPVVEAYFVQGSRLLGPMRNQDLPAFAQQQAAETFMAAQGGSLIRLEQITPDLLRSMEHGGH
jgi:nitrous oxide reductase accessory protein NosL